MEENKTNEKPSVTAEKARALGWVWVAVIVIIVAGILYVTQKKAPTEETNTNTNEAAVPVVKDIPVTPALGSVPNTVPTGSLFGLDWKVDADEQTFTSATGLVWDTTSHKGTLGTEITPKTSGYPSMTSNYNTLTAVPGVFEDNIKLPAATEAGALYLRVYATVAEKTYWSEEYVIPTKAAGAAVGGGS